MPTEECRAELLIGRRVVDTDGEAVGVVSCPSCANRFEVDLTEIEDGRLGE